MADEAAPASTWSPLAINMALNELYGPYYYGLMASVAAVAAYEPLAVAVTAGPQRASSVKRRKVESPVEATTNTRLLVDRRGRVTFKPYSDIRLDSCSSSQAGGECQPLKRKLGQPLHSPLHSKGTKCKKAAVVQPDRGCTIGNLFPEILSMIFEYLDVQSKGRVAQVRQKCSGKQAGFSTKCRFFLRLLIAIF